MKIVGIALKSESLKKSETKQKWKWKGDTAMGHVKLIGHLLFPKNAPISPCQVCRVHGSFKVLSSFKHCTVKNIDTA